MRSAWIGDEKEESEMGIDSDLKMKKKALRMNSERSLLLQGLVLERERERETTRCQGELLLSFTAGQALFDCMAAKMNEASNEQCTAVVLQWRCPKLIACRWLVSRTDFYK
ncbi:conserved hypothetical protein [Trichinella spiralis]|uniref:hypothetical protein n=1 Tax=Trichinella spiralis TaxID=6334 RepID=UPI0001EFD0E2|nr:conserved hypothetical protein [Trichinella spiralis]